MMIVEGQNRWFLLTQERGLVMFQIAWTKISSQQVLYYFMETPLHIYSMAEDSSQVMQMTHWFLYMLCSHEDRWRHVDALCALQVRLVQWQKRMMGMREGEKGRGRGSCDMSQCVSSWSPAGEGAICTERDAAQLHNRISHTGCSQIQPHMLSYLLTPFCTGPFQKKKR